MRACGLTCALVNHAMTCYYLQERYSEAMMERELEQFNRNLEQLGEPLRMRKNRIGDDFYDLLEIANEAGCARLPDLEKEGFARDLVWRNALYDVLNAGEIAVAELPLQAVQPFPSDILPCALWLAVWMRKHADSLAAPSRAALDPIALRLACLDHLGYKNGAKLLRLRFAVYRRFREMEKEKRNL